MRCLIIDDSKSFRCAAHGMLERAGFAVVGLASNSADGLQCYLDLLPDVTLVDVDLGEDSGFDLVEQLHASGVPRPPKVILISAHAEQDLAELIAGSLLRSGFCRRSGCPPRGLWNWSTVMAMSRRLGTGRSASLQEGDDRTDAAVIVAGLGQVELGQDAAHVLLDGALGDPQSAGDARIGAALCHQCQHLELA